MAAERMTIPGQERLTEELRQAAARDALGHAVILSGSGDLLAAARFVAAAMECEGPDRPCGQCGPCRKVLRGIHPDVAVVEDPEHRNVAVEVLRRAAPLEGAGLLTIQKGHIALTQRGFLLSNAIIAKLLE